MEASSYEVCFSQKQNLTFSQQVLNPMIFKLEQHTLKCENKKMQCDWPG